MDVGKRLRELREAKGLSQGEVEALTGVPRDEISRIEIGHATVNVPVLERWASALGVDLQDFFVVGEERPKTPGALESEQISAPERTLLQLFRQMSAEDRSLLTSLARDMAKRKVERG